MAVRDDRRGYYEALGVDRTASADDIKAAFRQRAKDLHPDQGGPAADKGAFRQLLEAYETLRDPQRRLRYDAELLEQERGGERSEPFADAAPSRFRRTLAPRDVVLGGALAAMALVAAIGWLRAIERDRAVAELTARLRPPIAAADRSEPPQLFRTEFRFPAGMAELDPNARARLATVADDLRRRIAELPHDRQWQVVVEGAIERAADGRGLLVAAWELTLLRVGVTAQYLVGQGIPADRVSVRFYAGALRPDGPPTHGVMLGLVCCLDGGPDGAD